MPKTLLAIACPGLIAFVIGIFVGRSSFTGNAVVDPILNGLGAALFVSAAASYIVAVVVCGLKGKPWFVVFGLLALAKPGISILPIVGAIRLAKPTSIWARRYYTEGEMRLARMRFPECYTSVRNDSASAIEISRDAPGGTVYHVQPERSATFPGDLSTIGIVVRTTGFAFHYSPFKFQALPTPYKRRPKYSYVFTAEHTFYPLGSDGVIIRDAEGFPVDPRSSET